MLVATKSMCKEKSPTVSIIAPLHAQLLSDTVSTIEDAPLVKERVPSMKTYQTCLQRRKTSIHVQKRHVKLKKKPTTHKKDVILKAKGLIHQYLPQYFLKILLKLFRPANPEGLKKVTNYTVSVTQRNLGIEQLRENSRIKEDQTEFPREQSEMATDRGQN